MLTLCGVGATEQFLPLGDSITAGALGGPNSEAHGRGGYRYFLERFLEGSEGGPAAFDFTGSVTNSPGTIAAYAGQWFVTEKPLNHPLHSGYSGNTIEQIEALVADGTIPVAGSDVFLLQIGTNNIGYDITTPATPPEIAGWKLSYENLLDAILAKNPAAKVAMAKIPPVTDGTSWIDGKLLGRIASNAARIEPFNEQVVAVVHGDYAGNFPGQFFLVDNYTPLDPNNFSDDPSFASATNHHDFFTGLGDGVHPYNAGHRKMATGFWEAVQLAHGKGAAEIITPLDDPDGDGIGGADICLLGDGTKRHGLATDFIDQPYVLASANPHARAKFYIRLDLSELPMNWTEARFNLVFWGAPDSTPGFANCCNDAPSATTLRLYGIDDGADGWTEAGISWANAPGNDPDGNGVDGTLLGEFSIPAGARTGDVISLSTPALRNFVNHARGSDGLLTFAVVGVSEDPGLLVSFQDSELRDYAPPFLQLTAAPAPRILPIGDSITGGALGGPNSPPHGRGGFRYYLERFLEGSQGGADGFGFNGSITNEPGTIVSYAGQWHLNERPLKHPKHSGYAGYTIEGIDALVNDGTIPVAGSDIALLQIGTNNVGYDNTTPATPTEIAGWKLSYQNLLDSILTSNPEIRIAMAKIPPVTDGTAWVNSVLLGRSAANAARIEPFNEQVVAALHADYALTHPGQFFLVDNYRPLDPANFCDDPSFATATNEHDYFTGLGDGVHPYNAGHRKLAGNFWRAIQLAHGAGTAAMVTPLDDTDNDGTGGADACLLGDGTKRLGLATDVDDQPYILASTTQATRAKHYIQLDLSGMPKNWDEARFNLVFWGAPDATPTFGNCCDDQATETTLHLYGIADGADGWTEDDITWANAPGNDPAGNGVSGTLLGEFIVPAGTRTGDVISLSTPALRDFVNHDRGADGLLTFAVVGVTEDPGFLTSFQDSDFKDYAPPFLQLQAAPVAQATDLRVLSAVFDYDAVPQREVTITFRSSDTASYLVSASDDLSTYDEVLAAGIPGALGMTETTVTVPLPPGVDRLFLRVEQQ